MTVVYRFSRYSLDPQARELRADGRLLRLPASAFDCLTYLIRQRQRAVGRDELIAAVWGRADVSEKLLGQIMVRIRRALGDRIDEPLFVRTVARFGYRWIAETEEAAAAPGEAAAPGPARPPVDTAAAEPPETARTATEPALLAVKPAATRRKRAIAAAALGLAVAALALLAVHAHRVPPAAAPTQQAPGIVLPARVEASDQWSWLRLGLMDLVATRLRHGGVTTLNSESVVGLLRSHALDDEGAGALPAHALEVRPSATFDGVRWSVRLEARGATGELGSMAQSADVLAAARAAVDALLLKLGHTPPADADAPPRALDELLQRANAAALAEQFQYAADLIDRAPDALRETPDVEVLRGLIEIRSGRYADAERRLRALLDRRGTATPTTQARALNALGAIHVRRNQPDEAGAEYDEAAKLMRDGGDTGVLGYADMGRGMVASMRGDLGAAVAALERARVEMEAAGNELGGAIVQLDFGQVQLRRRRPAEALATLRAAAERLERYGAREELVYARLFQSQAQMNLLDVTGALATSSSFWPAETATGNQRLRWQLVLARACALAANGRLDEADRLVAQLRAGIDPDEDADVRLDTEALAADVAHARGRFDEAARLAAAVAVPGGDRDDPDLYLSTSLTQLRSLIAARRLADAAAAAARLQDWLARRDDPWHRAYSALAAGLLAQAQGRRDVALGDFAAAATQLGADAQPQDLVAILQPYALGLIDAGRLGEATAVVARMSAFADTSLDVAWAQVRLYGALGRGDARRRASERATLLAGERSLPAATVASTAPDAGGR